MSNRSADDALEECIELEALRLQTSPNKSDRRDAWENLQRLHKLRSARKVAAMEKEQGLAK